MTISEAHRLLNTSPEESYSNIRKKYLRLMKENHPDNKEECPQIDVRLVNEAYHFIVANKAFISPGKGRVIDWDAETIPQAFCERTVYFQHIFDDGMVHQIPMATGKYLWNTDAEDFSMLMKSVYKASHKLAQKEDPVIFHYLMQEFIDPLYALEHIPVPWVFKCRITLPMDYGQIRSISSRLYACSVDGSRSEFSFSDKSLNYVVTPLIQSGSAVAGVENNRIKLSLTGTPFNRNYTRVNALIRKRIQNM